MELFFAVESYEFNMMVAEKEFDVAMSEIAYLESMIEQRLALNIKRSELKCINESTDDTFVSDLIYLVNEATNEAADQSEGIFTKAWNAIKGFFIKLANSVQKIFTGENMKAYEKYFGEKVQVPFNPEPMLDAAENVVQKVKSVSWLQVAGITGAIAGVAAFGFAGVEIFKNWDTIKENMEKKNQKIDTNGKTLTQWGQRASNLVTSITDLMGKKEDEAKNSDDPQKTTGFLQSLQKGIKGLCDTIIGWLKNLGKKNNDGTGDQTTDGTDGQQTADDQHGTNDQNNGNNQQGTNTPRVKFTPANRNALDRLTQNVKPKYRTVQTFNDINQVKSEIAKLKSQFANNRAALDDIEGIENDILHGKGNNKQKRQRSVTNFNNFYAKYKIK